MESSSNSDPAYVDKWVKYSNVKSCLTKLLENSSQCILIYCTPTSSQVRQTLELSTQPRKHYSVVVKPHHLKSLIADRGIPTCLHGKIYLCDIWAVKEYP